MTNCSKFDKRINRYLHILGLWILLDIVLMKIRMKFEFLFPFLEIEKVFASFENLNMININRNVQNILNVDPKYIP